MDRCRAALTKDGWTSRCTKDSLHIYDYHDFQHEARGRQNRPWQRWEWYEYEGGDTTSRLMTTREDKYAWQEASP